MKTLTYLLLVLCLSFVFSCKDNDEDNLENLTKNTNEFPEYEEYTTDFNLNDTTKNEQVISEEVVVNDNVMVEDTLGNPVPATTDDLKAQNKNFYIIVGSYQKIENANKRADYFKKQGYTAEVLPKFGNYHRVSISSFNDEKASRSELKALRSKLGDQTFWLLYR